MSANPSAILRLWNEFDKIEPDARLNGIYTGKRGYHNTRANHLAGRNGGSPSDYSITDSPLDLLGPDDKAAAIDINLESARLRSDFRNIAKYSRRLMAAFQSRDPRLFYDGKPVVREFFGNTDDDREVEGWSLLRGRAVTSDSTHLWHIHISFHRWAVEVWPAVAGVLAVLIGAEPEPLPEDDMQLSDQMDVPQWLRDMFPNDKGLADGSMSVQTALASGYAHSRTARAEIAELRRYVVDHHADVLANVQQNETAIHQLAQQVAELLAKLEPTEPPPGGEQSYTVVQGDTLAEIAGRFGVSVDLLAERNSINDPDRIFPGQVLIIPEPPSDLEA